jgi:hypothetical protein
MGSSEVVSPENHWVGDGMPHKSGAVRMPSGIPAFRPGWKTRLLFQLGYSLKANPFGCVGTTWTAFSKSEPVMALPVIRQSFHRGRALQRHHAQRRYPTDERLMDLCFFNRGPTEEDIDKHPRDQQTCFDWPL